MSVHAMAWVLKHSQSRMVDRLVLIAIADNANSDGADAWPSIPEIAAKAGISKRGVYYSIANLKRLGELTVDKKLVNHRRRNCYQVVMTGAHLAPRTHAKRAPKESATGAPRAQPQVHSVRTTGAPHGTAVLKPPTNHPTNRPYGALLPADDHARPTAQTLIGEWIDHCPKRPPSNVIGQIGKHVQSLLAEGIDYTDVRRGLQAWQTKGLHPSTLPSVVNEVMNAGHNGAKPSTTDQRVQAALDLAAKFAGEGQ